MTIDKDNIAHETFLTTTYHCDERYLADTTFCFQIIQECAALHGRLRGVSIPDMAPLNKTWVILRSTIDIKKYPAWAQDVHVQTWVPFEKSYFGPRGFVVTNDDGSTFFEAKTLWAVLDKRTRVPQKLGDISEKLQPCLVDDEAHKLPRLPKLDMSFITNNPVMKEYVPTAYYQDSDINGHINNIVYYQWMLQSLDDSFMAKHKPVYIDINWLHEVHKSDVIKVRVRDMGEGENREHTYGFTVDRLSPDGAELCCCAAMIRFGVFE